MKKVLVTGGAGFIGSHVTDRLLARGDRVLVIDNYATGRRDNLQPHANLRTVEGSIADTGLVNRLFDDFGPERVIHAAASYKDPNAWSEDALTNVVGTVNITQASERTKVARLIYFQTALCYGLHPLEQPITLGHPLRPYESSYSVSKTAGESYISLSKVDFISFRLANAYGPRNLSGPLPTFFQRLTAGKKCFVMDTRRDFVYVGDLVEVVLKALDGAGTRGPYHVSSGKDYSIKELFDETVKAMNIRLDEPVEVRERNPDDAFTILLDPSKTNLDFSWKVSTPLDSGVPAAVRYYLQSGVTETYTHLKALDAKQ
jgi:UDP-glucose 4-epimerase